MELSFASYASYPVRRSGIFLITQYQRWLSPHKGFVCAHRFRRRGWSCSEFVKRALARGGVVVAWRLAQRRFAACRRSADLLKAAYKKRDDRDPDRRERNCDVGNCDITDVDLCVPFACDGCGDIPTDGCSGGDHCDIGGCDAGHCDFGGCSW